MSRVGTSALTLAVTVAVATATLGVADPTTAVAAPSPTLVLSDQLFAVTPDQPWSATFTLDVPVGDILPVAPSVPSTSAGPTSSVPDVAAAPVDAQIRIVLHRTVDDRAELADVLDGGRSTVVDTLTLPLEPALSTVNGTTTLTIEAPTAVDPNRPDALTLRQPGLYPVSVEIIVDGGVIAEHSTFLERLPLSPTSAPPLSIAMLAAAPDPGPTLTTTEITDGRAHLAAIAATAAAVDGPISVALPPVLLDDLATDDPALSETMQSSLAGDEVQALPADPLDPSSIVAIDEEATFARQLREGEDISNRALPASPSRRASWIMPAAMSTSAATMLGDLGFRMLVMDQDTYNELDGSIGGFLDNSQAIEVDLGDAGTLPAMVISPLGRLLDPTVLEQTGTAPTDAAVEIMATLLTARRELGAERRRSVVLATPDLSAPDPLVAEQLAAFASRLPDVELAPLSALPSTTDTMTIGDEGPQQVRLPASAGPDLRERSERINLTSVSAESAGSMMPDDTQLEAWRTELQTMLSTGLADADVDASLDRISAEAQAVRDQVEAPRPFTFTLTGRESELRLNLHNDADETRRVLVTARSPKLTFPEGDQIVVLAPSGSTEVVIPVVARSNGTSSIEIEVLTPAIGQRVEGPVVLTARVNALTGLGQVITGAAVLVLISWWFGHFRRRRRKRLAELAALDSTAAFDLVSPDAAEVSAVAHVDAAGSGSLVDP